MRPAILEPWADSELLLCGRRAPCARRAAPLMLFYRGARAGDTQLRADWWFSEDKSTPRSCRYCFKAADHGLGKCSKCMRVSYC